MSSLELAMKEVEESEVLAGSEEDQSAQTKNADDTSSGRSGV